jgi:hypothetical protein
MFCGRNMFVVVVDVDEYNEMCCTSLPVILIAR